MIHGQQNIKGSNLVNKLRSIRPSKISFRSWYPFSSPLFKFCFHSELAYALHTAFDILLKAGTLFVKEFCSLPIKPEWVKGRRWCDNSHVLLYFFSFMLFCSRGKEELKDVIHRLCTAAQLIWAIQTPLQCVASSSQTKQRLQFSVTPFHSGYQYRWWMTELPTERKCTAGCGLELLALPDSN